MSKQNPLVGLIGNYDDSEEESDDTSTQSVAVIPSKEKAVKKKTPGAPRPGIHRAPISHCPWSACYDEKSGFTYYWNQQTNAVTWEAPAEYLLALKVAQQHLNKGGTSQLSATEWQMYQQALLDQQKSNKVPPQPSEINDKLKSSVKSKVGVKRRASDEEKIELITSYYNSDSESNDESESPIKPPPPPKPVQKPKVPAKKPKTKEKEPIVTYGPSLPPKQNYSVPIGPEMPPELIETDHKNTVVEQEKPTIKSDQEENALLKELKDKAKILENLGGQIPPELQEIIEEKTDTPNDSIDDLLSNIEKKELPKVKSKLLSEENNSKPGSLTNSPQREDLIEPKSLFPSAKNIHDEPPIEVNTTERSSTPDRKNLYLNDTEVKEIGRKKLRISNSVLPDRTKSETPAYTTKYSQFIEGFSSERTGLGFTQEAMDESSPKTTISYGNGLTFTKGETLNEEKKEDEDDLEDLMEAKLRYLNSLETNPVTPIQEMYIQLQTLLSGRRAGGVSGAYCRSWSRACSRALAAHEAPPGWTCCFLRSEGRYQYARESDGLVQWEYPAVTTTDMDISTTPPHNADEGKEDPLPPPSPPRTVPSRVPSRVTPRPITLPPPKWPDPPPPGCDDAILPKEQNRQIGDELMSFYSDIAELEKTDKPASGHNTATNSPEPVRDTRETRAKSKDKETKVVKKKSKVKISSSIGMKHKTVSSMVAKWQQVAEQIHSD